MREASFLVSLLGDCVAKGDIKKLQVLSERWRKRATVDPYDGGTIMGVIWRHASDAAYYQAHSVEFRMCGWIGRAMNKEAVVDNILTCIAEYGVDKSRGEGAPPYDAATATGMYDHD